MNTVVNITAQRSMENLAAPVLKAFTAVKTAASTLQEKVKSGDFSLLPGEKLSNEEKLEVISGINRKFAQEISAPEIKSGKIYDDRNLTAALMGVKDGNRSPQAFKNYVNGRLGAATNNTGKSFDDLVQKLIDNVQNIDIEEGTKLLQGLIESAQNAQEGDLDDYDKQDYNIPREPTVISTKAANEKLAEMLA